LQQRFARVGEVPFSSERKLMSTLHTDAEREGRVLLFTKGAPDVLLTRCTCELVGEEWRPLTDRRRHEILAANELVAGRALRTLGVAFRASGDGTLTPAGLGEQVERDLVFAGLIGMIDPPRDEAHRAVARAKGAGIRPVMITGDHPRTAAVIAMELGVADSTSALSGADLDRLSDDELAARVREASVYARVNPEHKLRIVDALQRTGAVVAMTGDGVNDAPALKRADIGVAMGVTGTDVSKQAADMVLADDNFATIVAAVEEGRSIFANIRRFLRYLLSSNIGEVMTMFLGVVFAKAIGLELAGSAVVLPLVATQLLWINLVTDGAPALALGLDPPDDALMRRRPRPSSGAGDYREDVARHLFRRCRDGDRNPRRSRRRASGRAHRGCGDAAPRPDAGVHDARAVSDVQSFQRQVGRRECVSRAVRQPLVVGGYRPLGSPSRNRGVHAGPAARVLD
jgi:Ca2+-transporting ATPase